MRSAILLTVASAIVAHAATGTLGDAATISNNPVGPTYTAVLPTTEFFNPADPRGNVKGSITATAGPGGVGVAFTVNFSNLPTSGGPFPYHIHVAPVSSNGSCAAALAHLDPYIRGEEPPCDPTMPATCQVGDLSGKHGKINSDPFTASYVDPFASILPGIGAFFGNRSVVVHFSNKTRITCANFALAGGASLPPNSTVTTSPAKPTTTPYTGSATSMVASLMSVFGIVAAVILL